MAFANPFSSFAFGEIFDTVLPDFVLAFAFFTAITYAVLSRRFGEQRPAVAMSAALGMALAVGLVWWEYSKGVSIRNLGPIAAGFAVIVLAGVIYQSVRGIQPIPHPWSALHPSLHAPLILLRHRTLQIVTAVPIEPS